MKNFKYLDAPTPHVWLEMNDDREPDGIRDKCTAEYISKRLTKFNDVTVADVRIYGDGTYSDGASGPQEDLPPFCKVTLKRQVGFGRTANIYVFLPLVWNKRLISITGGGSASFVPYIVGVIGRNTTEIVALRNHFVAVANDAANDASMKWGFRENSDELDWHQILYFSHLAPHDGLEIAKEICRIVYGVCPEYNYIAGSSGGGRQVLNQIKTYPQDYDGGLSVCPAFPWIPLVCTVSWWFIVMNNYHHVIPMAKLDAVKNAVCEKYGCSGKPYIDTAYFPTIDPAELVGMETEAGPITEEDARILKIIWDGPTYSDGRVMKDCHGISPTVDYWHAGMVVKDDGTLSSDSTSTGLGNQMLGWIARDPNFRLENCTFEDLDELYDRGRGEFKFCDPDNIDMDEYRDRGGKLIHIAGCDDVAIDPKASVDHYRKVVKYYGSEEAVDKFYKFYLTHGNTHGILGDGTYAGYTGTGDTWIALMRWVEEGVEPGALPMMPWDHQAGTAVYDSTYAKPYRVSEE